MTRTERIAWRCMAALYFAAVAYRLTEVFRAGRWV